jgi:hypothetical protein
MSARRRAISKVRKAAKTTRAAAAMKVDSGARSCTCYEGSVFKRNQACSIHGGE